jgi:predicted ABC-type transport system involved in lysophospholipase L1 biosynthesis ATPase subunit
VSEPVLSARGVTRRYRSGDAVLEVLRGADIDVAPGESVSIRGESGSGKSTLLNILAGLDAPDSGTVLWEGSADTGARRRAAFLGMVFQSFYLVPELDALANVLLARRILGKLDAPSRGRAMGLLSDVGLAGRAHHLPSELSGGERQRVALARALVNRPRLLVADEPTGNLDERTGDSMVELLLGLCASENAALVLVTHNAAHASKTARSLVLADGRLAPAARRA